MDELNLNKILNRENIYDEVVQLLNNFENNKDNCKCKKGIYIYGNSGSGKTKFVTNILHTLGYNIIMYDAGDIRNKTVIETITKYTTSKNIISILNNKPHKVAIIMDEIDGMNNGDKGGINMLIKLIRPKKTKKQKLEETTLCPIICIGNYHIDKKIKELMKVCHIIDFKSPTNDQLLCITQQLIPNINTAISNKIINYAQNDLKKLNMIYLIYQKNPNIFSQNNNISNLFQLKSFNDDTKKNTKKLINNSYKINDHNSIMNETDRTTIGLLWHENIIDVLCKMNKNISIPFYLKQLDNICFADYIDRITFQKQIWQFNEMSSLIKTMKNNNLYHTTFKKKQHFNPVEVRFTKVLTKYSTEFNNLVFIHNLCQQLLMNKNDMILFFNNLKNNPNINHTNNLYETYELSKLDINRINRYIDKYTSNDIDTNDIIDNNDNDNDNNNDNINDNE
jgi:hypothetical protein